MPAKLSVLSAAVTMCAAEMGKVIRARRKDLKVSATTASEAAGMSRVTWHRLEKGATSITLGSFLSALSVLDLDVKITSSVDSAHNFDNSSDFSESIPVRIAFADYPQLKKLAWQVSGVDELSPREALDIYERNSRHLDLEVMEPREQHLISALRKVFAEEVRNV